MVLPGIIGLSLCDKAGRADRMGSFSQLIRLRIKMKQGSETAMAERSEFYESVKERMIRYAKINTQSLNGTGKTPSTECQYILAEELEKELRKIGAAGVELDRAHCIVYAEIPSNLPEGQGMEIGFIAHMDTAPDASGENVKPWVLENYPGGDILLNSEKGIVMKASEFENLNAYIGQDLILTDGTTLLGGDDKASIAAIMTMAEYFLHHPDALHGRICLAFTPDEEVGGLAKDLDLKRFGSKLAYTLDGDHLGWYEDETFNASSAEIEITGRSVHTGTAKGIMINAVDAGAEFISMLPAEERPQTTEGRQGFYHVSSFAGSCEHAQIRMIIRDHDASKFEERKEFVRSCAARLQEKYGHERISLNIQETYRNMKEVIDTVPFMITDLVRAIRECGAAPKSEAFRGGTDGAALSFRGLPCPNLSAGYENAHGRFEYVPIQSMEKNVEILIRLCGIYAEKLR